MFTNSNDYDGYNNNNNNNNHNNILYVQLLSSTV